ncbi:cholesterol esterase [Microbotryomycetes sp. JL201]|nr:cholesterol esterase [Microbotryomycetes sp. JL201]
MSGEYVDYRRKSLEGRRGDDNEGGAEVERKKSSASARRGKNYADLDKADLEAEGRENIEHPLGNFMHNGQVQSKEGDEEAYIGGVTAFGTSRTARGYDEYDEKSGDLGRTRSGGRRYEEESREPREKGGYREPEDLGYDPDDRDFVHPHEIPTYPTQNFYRRCVLNGFQIGSALGTTLGFNLIAVMAFVWYAARALNPFHKGPPKPKYDKEWERRITGERFSSRAEYYAEFYGYECESLDVETEDGFILRVHHLISPKHKRLGHPVILQHGILSNSVTFMVNEERSLAFWLLEQGYDVYLSNIRTNFKMPHRHFPRSDPRYWAWSIEQVGVYDLPAIVDYVVNRTGRKPAYIGHSQGTGTMFLCLSRVREFIPIIGLLQAILPSWLFGHAAAPIFCFLFGFHTVQWLPRQIPKFFRTVAVPNSSELLYYYMSKLSYNNCIFDTQTREPWFPRSFPPLAIFYGTRDMLVLGKPLVERIRQHEVNVDLRKVVSLQDYEHLDMLWGVNAVEEVFFGIKEMIEETKGC